MKKWLIGTGVIFVLLIVVFVPRKFDLVPGAPESGRAQVNSVFNGSINPGPSNGTLEATSTVTQAMPSPIYPRNSKDIEPQKPLDNPPSIVKAIYLTGWSGGSAKKIDSVIALAKRTEINAVVVDVKDYSGFVSYAMDIPLLKENGAMGDLRIKNPNEMIKKFHDAGIYVIGRITVFQDPVLAKYKPEWALKYKTTGAVWADNRGLAWMDPAGQGTWDYIVSIARDASERGFDEVNFDYVRFASDGALGNISFPFWDMKSPRHVIIAKFFSYLRDHTAGIKISADLFGLATVNHDDLGIGQVIEDAYKYFDYVSPMVYPSHYATGFLGYKKPALYPYEVMKYSLDKANERWWALVHPKSTSTVAIAPEKLGKLRPWIQDFNMGATYDAAMVRKEYKAVYDSLLNSSTTGAYAGWYVWDPSNVYTEAALQSE